MRRGREDQLSETSARPAFLDEFERRLAAALAQQTDARNTRLGSARSSDVNVEVASSPSLGEAITPRSMGEKQALDVGPLRPSGKTRERRTQFSTAEPTRVSPRSGTTRMMRQKRQRRAGLQMFTRPNRAARRSDLAETSSQVARSNHPPNRQEALPNMKRRRPSPTPCRSRQWTYAEDQGSAGARRQQSPADCRRRSIDGRGRSIAGKRRRGRAGRQTCKASRASDGRGNETVFPRLETDCLGLRVGKRGVGRRGNALARHAFCAQHASPGG